MLETSLINAKTKHYIYGSLLTEVIFGNSNINKSVDWFCLADATIDTDELNIFTVSLFTGWRIGGGAGYQAGDDRRPTF